MIGNLIFSLNATIPVFLVIVAGVIFRKINLLTIDFANVANKFNYKVTLPILLFTQLTSVDIRAEFDLSYVLFCMIVTTVSFFIVWGLTRLINKDKLITPEFVQASFRGSAAVLGVAFIQNINGSSDIGMAPLMMIGAVPLYNIYSVIVLTFESNTDSDKTVKKAVIEVFKNPILISIFLGLVCSLIRIDFPTIVDATLNNFAKLATPLALLCIGIGFEGKKALAKIKPTLLAASIKLAILPLCFLPIAIAMGFTDDKLIALLIMLGAPTTPSCYIMAKNTGNNGVLTSSIVMTTTLLSAFTITVAVYIFKTFGLI